MSARNVVGTAVAIAVSLAVAVTAFNFFRSHDDETATTTTTTTTKQRSSSNPKEEPDAVVAVVVESFEEAATKVKTIKTLTDSQKLMIYGLYKQVTEGDAATTITMSTWNPVALAKHGYWSKFRGISQEQAKIMYVDAVNKILTGKTLSSSTTTATTTTTAQALQQDQQQPLDESSSPSMGEEWEEDDDMDLGFGFGSGMGMRPSMPAMDQDDESENDDDDDDDDKKNRSKVLPLHQAARRGDIEQLRQLLQTLTSSVPSSLQEDDEKDEDHHHGSSTFTIQDRDETGQTALHLVADHGADDCVQLLLAAGADPNAADLDGISVLQTAVIADHVSTAAILLQAGANPDQADMDGDSPRTCAEQSTTEMQHLFATFTTSV